MTHSVLVLNGANLNMLGQREPEIYGTETLEDVERACLAHGAKNGLAVVCAHSNSEGGLIDHIQAARGKMAAIVLNAGGYTHTSIALRDAVVAAEVPMIEVHISNIHAREPFRSRSYLSEVARGVLFGFGTQGYIMALDFIAARLLAEPR